MGYLVESVDQDIIEVNPSCFKSFGDNFPSLLWSNDEQVEVLVVTRIPVASRIFLSPAQNFDWEVVNSNAGRIEQSLLQSFIVIPLDGHLEISITNSIKAKLIAKRIEYDSSQMLLARNSGLVIDAVALADGTELAIEPPQKTSIKSIGRVINSSSSSIKSKALVNFSRMDIANASSTLALRVIPQKWRTIRTNIVDQANSNGRVEGTGSIIDEDLNEALDAFLLNETDHLHASKTGVSPPDQPLPWETGELRDNAFTVFIHPVVVQQALELMLSSSISSEDVASYMRQTQYPNSWLGSVEAISQRGSSDPQHPSAATISPSILRQTVRIVVSDWIRPLGISLPSIVQRILQVEDFHYVRLTIHTTSRPLLPASITLRPIFWQGDASSAANKAREQDVMNVLRLYHKQFQQSAMTSRRRSSFQSNPIINAFIQLADQQSSSRSSQPLVIGQGSIVRLDVRMLSTSQEANHLKDNSSSSLEMNKSSLVRSTQHLLPSTNEQRPISLPIEFVVEFTLSSAQAAARERMQQHLQNSLLDYFTLAVWDDEDTLCDTLSLIKVDHLSSYRLADQLQEQHLHIPRIDLTARILGCSSVFRQLFLDLSQALVPSAVFHRIVHNTPVHSILTLLGPTLVGKSTVLQTIQHGLLTQHPELLIHTDRIDCQALKALDAPLDTLMRILSETFHRAMASAPSVILLDDLDALCRPYAESENLRDERSLLLTVHLVRLFEDFATQQEEHHRICRHAYEALLEKGQNLAEMPVADDGSTESRVPAYSQELIVSKVLQRTVTIVLTASSLEALDASLLSSTSIGRIRRCITMPSTIADGKTRLQLLQYMLRNEGMELVVDKVSREPLCVPYQESRILQLIKTFERQSEGFRPGDLNHLAHQVVRVVHERCAAQLSAHALEAMIDEMNRSLPPLIPSTRISEAEHHSSGSAGISAQDLWRMEFAICTLDDILEVLLERGFEPPSVAGSSSKTNATKSAASKGSSSARNVVSWDKVGGYAGVQQTIVRLLRYPILYRRLYARSPIKLPRAILLYGAPGVGKTYFAQAAGHDFDLGFVAIRGPQLLDKYIGASEKAVRDLFQQARASLKPVLLFFDEFEALAPRRGKDNTGVTDRVVNQLLTFIDGVEGNMSSQRNTSSKTKTVTKPKTEATRSNGQSMGRGSTSSMLMDLGCNVGSDTDSDDDNEEEDATAASGHHQQIFIMVASSRPDLIDPALLRPGRIEKHVHIGYPSAADCRDILHMHLRQVLNTNSKKENSDELLKSAIQSISEAKKASLMTAADLKAVVDTAYLYAVHGALETKKQQVPTTSSASVFISADHLLQAFADTRPSILPQDRAFFESIYERFQHSAAEEKGQKKAAAIGSTSNGTHHHQLAQSDTAVASSSNGSKASNGHTLSYSAHSEQHSLPTNADAGNQHLCTDNDTVASSQDGSHKLQQHVFVGAYRSVEDIVDQKLAYH